MNNNTLQSKPWWKKVLPHVVAIAIMYLLTVFYFSPIFMDNKDLPQGDDISAICMVKDARDLAAEDGIGSEWSNGMFCGMPTTTVSGQGTSFNVFGQLAVWLRLGLPGTTAGMLFSYLIGFYIFMVCMGANAWFALLGAIAYGFTSYNIIIIHAGHVTKGYAMAYIAPMLGGVMLCFRKKYLPGFLITLTFLGILISRSHVQIDYYAALMVACVGISYLVYYIIASIRKTEQFSSFLKAAGLLVVAAGLAVLPSVGSLYPTAKYSKDTMRGGAELSITPEHQQVSTTPNAGGLDIDYAYAWSYGKMETFTQLVPNLYGGGHVMLEKTDPVVKELRDAGYGSPYLPTYWGEQPFTEGPVYVGAIVCFLFILGLFVVKGPEKWWVIAACVVSFILAWGKNLMPINEWLFHNLPMYNKFRTPSMSLVIAGVAMPMLGLFALKDIFNGNIEKQKAWKYTYISFFISAGLCLLLMIIGKSSFSFTGAGDPGFKQQLASAGFDQGRIDNILDILINYRKSMLMKDAFRSIVFIALAFGMLWLYLKNFLKKEWMLTCSLAVLVLIDLWAVDRRYLNDDSFERKQKTQNIVPKTATDEQILLDKDINYRVLNMASNTFNEAQTSFYHKSVGGYSPAKLRRYQDLIDFYIADDMQKALSAIVKAQGNMAAVDANAYPILNMLNTKYFIVPLNGGATMPLMNPYRQGNAWFVQNVKMVDNADAEILALGKTDLRTTAIIDKRFAADVTAKSFTTDSSNTIVNTLCKPNHLTYKTSTKSQQLAVFSEIYYDRDGWQNHKEDGWEVTIDGKQAPLFRANYVLRAMMVPAGEHVIDFKFVPYTRFLGQKISNISSVVNILVLLSGVGFICYRRRKEVVPEAE